MMMNSFLKNLAFCVSLAALSLILSACNNTPFAPIAVPDTSSVRPTIDTSPKKLNDEELVKLQNVRPLPYRICPGDSFMVIISGQEDLSKGVTVMPDGTISFAPVGSILVAGKTFTEVSIILESRMSRYVKDCRVFIEPTKTKEYEYTISGFITNQGIYPLTFGETRLVDAITAAGGPMYLVSDDASMRLLISDFKNAYIIRDGKTLYVDFVKAFNDGDPLNNIPLLDGDYIYIPSLEKGQISVLGDTSNKNVPYQPNMTLIQLMAQCNGLKDTACDTIKVIRGGMDNPVVYNIDFMEIQKGRKKDFLLEPRDVVFVPKIGVAQWNIIIGQILPTVQFINGLAGPFGSPSSFIYQ